MKILVCISNVPDTTAKITFTDDDTKLNKTGVAYIIGPYDDYALARAVELKEQLGATITVLHVGLADSEPQIRKALAIGADEAIRVDTDPIDSLYVAQQIAQIAQQEQFDLIMMGRESIDYNSGVVHGLVGGLLNIPAFSPVMELQIEGTTVHLAREIEGGKEYLRTTLPIIVGCQEPIAEWKIPNMRGIMTARTKPLKVVPASDSPIGTQLKRYHLPAAKKACQMIDASQAATLIHLLRTEAKVL